MKKFGDFLIYVKCGDLLLYLVMSTYLMTCLPKKILFWQLSPELIEKNVFGKMLYFGDI